MIDNEIKITCQEVVLKLINNTSVTKNVAKTMRNKAKAANIRRFALCPPEINLSTVSLFFLLLYIKPVKNGIIATIVSNELIRHISKLGIRPDNSLEINGQTSCVKKSNIAINKTL